MAGSYRNNQREAVAQFDEYIGATIIDTVQAAARHLDCTVHAVTVDPSHIHFLISWRYVRSWQSMRTSLKSAISRALNTHHSKRIWLSKGASQKRIRDQKHFDHHSLHSLPAHVGCSWFRDADVRAARKRVERVPEPRRYASQGPATRSVAAMCGGGGDRDDFLRRIAIDRTRWRRRCIRPVPHIGRSATLPIWLTSRTHHHTRRPTMQHPATA